MGSKLHHIAIIVEDLEGSIKRFQGFGFMLGEVAENKNGGYRIAFFPVGDSLIELINYSRPPEDPLTRIVRSHQGRINHVCLEVGNIQSTIQAFEKNGARLIEGCPKMGVTGPIAFFYPETTEGVLIEICEIQKTHGEKP